MTEQSRRRRRVVGWTAVLAVTAGVFAWVVGVEVVQAVLVVTAVTATGATYAALGGLDHGPGRDGRLPAVQDTGRSDGTRREVSRLSWGLDTRDDRVGGIPYHRLRALAANRLRLRGVDLDEPAGRDEARRLLGPLAYETLVEPQPGAPTQRTFVACIAVLEGLDATTGAAHTSPTAADRRGRT